MDMLTISFLWCISVVFFSFSFSVFADVQFYPIVKSGIYIESNFPQPLINVLISVKFTVFVHPFLYLLIGSGVALFLPFFLWPSLKRGASLSSYKKLLVSLFGSDIRCPVSLAIP